ncbi:MAG: DUF362 domain-containing protein, partial [Nitrososphaerota archaeon]|nr:DUF362 domain-containing protein [Nitrososphaerota archaeon]
MESKRSAVKVYRASDTSVLDVLKEAVSDGRLSGKRVFVKPNLSHPEFLPGVVTDPVLTGDLIGLLRDRNCEVVVGESDGFNYPCHAAFDRTGMRRAVEKAGGSVVNLSEDRVVEVKFKGSSLSLKRLFLPKTVMDADVVVDLPLMKTHEFMAYSGAIKNLFGCIPSCKRIFLHPYLPEVFFRLYTLLKPVVTVMDARVGIEGNGPTKGKPVNMGLLLSSSDALALDVVAAKIMKLNWKDTYLNYVARRTGFQESSIVEEGVPVSAVARR